MGAAHLHGNAVLLMRLLNFWTELMKQTRERMHSRPVASGCPTSRDSNLLQLVALGHMDAGESCDHRCPRSGACAMHQAERD